MGKVMVSLVDGPSSYRGRHPTCRKLMETTRNFLFSLSLFFSVSFNCLVIMDRSPRSSVAKEVSFPSLILFVSVFLFLRLSSS